MNEVDSAIELLRIKPRPKNVVAKIQILTARAAMKDVRMGVLIESFMLKEIKRDSESFKDAWGIELFKQN